METKTPAKPKQPAGGWKKRLVFSAIVSAALTFTLCLFGPLDLFFNNYEEIWFHLQDIIGGLFLVAGIFFVLTTLVGTLLRGKLHDIYMALMFGGLVGTYVQASFMNKDYGLLNGTSVDWSAYTGYGVVNTVIWLVCILVPLIAMLIWKEKKVRPVFLFLSCALILMQGASLVVSYINYPTTTESVTLTNDKLFDLSKDENTIIYLVDTMDGAFLQDMMERHPEYADRLQGFTNYTNALAAGARTPVAMPLLFTGIPRTEPGAYADYRDSAWKDPVLFTNMRSNGFGIHLFTQPRYISPTADEYIDNLSMSSSIVGDYTGLTKKMYKLTLYKYVPHFLKWRFWMDTADFDKYQKQDKYVVNDSKFYQSYLKHKGFTYNLTGKDFRLYHMRGPHKPYNLNPDGSHSKTETSEKDQIDGIFNIIFNMMDDMKDNGVYDKANIFIMADHGENDLAQWSALLYKPAGSTGKYTENTAPVSAFDVTSTLNEIAGGDPKDIASGRTLSDIKEGEKRTRSFYRTSGSNATLNTDEYQTESTASDADSMKLYKQYPLQDASAAAEPYILGNKLSFRLNEATANIYCTEGFRSPDGGTTSIEGHHAQMVIPLDTPPKDGNLVVTLTRRDILVDGDMTITANGETVYEEKDMTPKSYDSHELQFTVPVSALKDDTLTLDITFSAIPKSEDNKDARQAHPRHPRLRPCHHRRGIKGGTYEHDYERSGHHPGLRHVLLLQYPGQLRPGHPALYLADQGDPAAGGHLGAEQRHQDCPPDPRAEPDQSQPLRGQRPHRRGDSKAVQAGEVQRLCQPHPHLRPAGAAHRPHPGHLSPPEPHFPRQRQSHRRHGAADRSAHRLRRGLQLRAAHRGAGHPNRPVHRRLPGTARHDR